MNTKYLQIALNVLQWILIFLSLISFGFIFWESIQLKLDLSSTGMQYYLSLYHPYSLLYGSMFIVLSTNLAIERLSLYTQTNNKNFKIGNRSSWIQITSIILDDIKDFNDPYMVKIFRKNLLSIHDYLFDIEFKFEDKNQLVSFFDRFIKQDVEIFEDTNVKGKFFEGLYRDENQNYAYHGFRYIFTSIVSITESYKNVLDDLFNLYQNEVKSIEFREVDKVRYRETSKEYHKQKLKKIKAHNNGS